MEKTITTSAAPEAFIYFRGALGDSILFLPVALAFLKKFPNGQLTMACPTEIFEVLLPLAMGGEPLFKSLENETPRFKLIRHSDARFRHFFDDTVHAEWPPELTEFLSSFTQRLWVTNDEKHSLKTALKHLGLAGENFIHPPFPPLGESVRKHHEALIQKLNWKTDREVPRTRRSPLREKILIHPGSGSALKNWPLVRYLELAKALHPHEVSFLFGPADETLLKECEAKWPKAIIHSGLSLAGVAVLLTTFHRYVGNDSGISHLAALLGIRSLVIALRSGAGFWDPVPEGVSVLFADDLSVAPSVSEAAFLVFKQGRD